jgi:hypothetical protein
MSVDNKVIYVKFKRAIYIISPIYRSVGLHDTTPPRGAGCKCDPLRSVCAASIVSISAYDALDRDRNEAASITRISGTRLGELIGMIARREKREDRELEVFVDKKTHVAHKQISAIGEQDHEFKSGMLANLTSIRVLCSRQESC